MDICAVKRNFLEKLKKTNLLNQSGAVLYSSYYTVKPGKFMIIGLNPGGDPEEIKRTIEQDINYKFEKSRENPKWNEFFDEEWIPGEPGCDRLQVNMRYFIRLLLGDREKLRDICATNLIFTRSKAEQDISKPQELAKTCWKKVHKWLLQQVKPEIIITYSAFAYHFIKNKLKNNKEVSKPHENEIEFSPKITIKIAKIPKASFINKEIYIVYIPHLSRHTFFGKEKVVEKIKEKLKL